MNDNNDDNNSQINNLFLKELNLLLKNAKEIEKDYAFLEHKKEQSNFNLTFGKNENLPTLQNIINNDKFQNRTFSNENKNLKELKTTLENKRSQKKSLERNRNILQNILVTLGNGYDSNFNNNYENNMTNEISNEILELYLSKNFDKSYNLWKQYNFMPLIGVSIERSFEILTYLNKIRDRFFDRKTIIEDLNKNILGNEDEIQYESNNERVMSNSEIYKRKNNQNDNFVRQIKEQMEQIKTKQIINKNNMVNSQN